MNLTLHSERELVDSFDPFIVKRRVSSEVDSRKQAIILILKRIMDQGYGQRS
jgi:hypothetical protein